MKKKIHHVGQRPQKQLTPKTYDIRDAELIVCKETLPDGSVCNGTVHLQAALIALLPSTHPQNDTGEPLLINKTVWYCVKCKAPYDPIGLITPKLNS